MAKSIYNYNDERLYPPVKRRRSSQGVTDNQIAPNKRPRRGRTNERYQRRFDEPEEYQEIYHRADRPNTKAKEGERKGVPPGNRKEYQQNRRETEYPDGEVDDSGDVEDGDEEGYDGNETPVKLNKEPVAPSGGGGLSPLTEDELPPDVPLQFDGTVDESHKEILRAISLSFEKYIRSKIKDEPASLVSKGHSDWCTARKSVTRDINGLYKLEPGWYYSNLVTLSLRDIFNNWATKQQGLVYDITLNPTGDVCSATLNVELGLMVPCYCRECESARRRVTKATPDTSNKHNPTGNQQQQQSFNGVVPSHMYTNYCPPPSAPPCLFSPNPYGSVVHNIVMAGQGGGGVMNMTPVTSSNIPQAYQNNDPSGNEMRFQNQHHHMTGNYSLGIQQPQLLTPPPTLDSIQRPPEVFKTNSTISKELSDMRNRFEEAKMTPSYNPRLTIWVNLGGWR